MAVPGDLTLAAGAPPDDVDQAVLLAWGERHLRDLPWRRSRDPWAVLVSEVMAQQTGVDRVIPYWHAFLGRFPERDNLASLVDQDLDG